MRAPSPRLRFSFSSHPTSRMWSMIENLKITKAGISQMSFLFFRSIYSICLIYQPEGGYPWKNQTFGGGVGPSKMVLSSQLSFTLPSSSPWRALHSLSFLTCVDSIQCTQVRAISWKGTVAKDLQSFTMLMNLHAGVRPVSVVPRRCRHVSGQMWWAVNFMPFLPHIFWYILSPKRFWF